MEDEDRELEWRGEGDLSSRFVFRRLDHHRYKPGLVLWSRCFSCAGVFLVMTGVTTGGGHSEQ